RGYFAMVSWNLLPRFGLAPRRFLNGRRRPRPGGRPQVERVEERVLTSVFGKDDRVKVKATGSYPFSAVVMVTDTFARHQVFYGSGALIDPYHVLTAAHVVYDGSLGGNATSIKVIPGRNGHSRPYGAALAVAAHVDPTYVNDENRRDADLAVVTLNRPIGASTGFFGLRAEPDSFFAGGVLNTAGYPGDKGRGKADQMYYSSGTAVDTSSGLVFHRIDTYNGQSGSPLWEISGDQRYIVAVHDA